MVHGVELRELIKAYPTLSWQDRLHMMVRWYVCPLPRIASLVPGEGIIVDLGCGHGLFTQLLARQASARTIIGIDLDEHKIALARQVTLPNLQFIAGDIAAADLPSAAAITILDVFYLIPFEIQERLLTICAKNLKPGGVLLLKDMAETPRWKFRLNQFEEILAVRLFHITASLKSEGFYFRRREDWQALLCHLGFEVQTIPMDKGYYHPHVVFVARKADA